MNISAVFIHRPIGTILLMFGLLLCGLVTYPLLPVASLPNVNFPTVQVTAQLPGADPQTMASSVATPLEQQFSQIPGLTQLTSSSALGYTQLSVQFNLSRDVGSAAEDVLAAINAASPYLPLNMPYPPTIRKVNPADTPILVLALTSESLPLIVVDAYAENILLPKISQISGVGLVGIGGQQRPAIRIQVDPQALASRGIGLEDVRTVLGQANVDQPKGTLNSPRQTYTLNTNDQLRKPQDYENLIVAYRNGSPVRIRDVGHAISAPENDLLAGWYNNKRAILLSVQREPGANVIETVDRINALLPQLEASIPPAIKVSVVSDRTQTIRASVADVQVHADVERRAGGDGDFPVPAQFLGDRHSGDYGAAVADRHLRSALRAQLQPRQPVAHGSDHRGRLRRRRCRGRDRKHRPPSGSGIDADGGGAQGLRRNRLHHPVDHAVADRGFHPAVSDERLCRECCSRNSPSPSASRSCCP